MFKIRDYEFETYKVIVGMHKSNYAVITNKPNLGLKYCPLPDFEGEYHVLRDLDHKQIPKAYEHGYDTLYENGKVVLRQYFIVLDHVMDRALIRYYREKGDVMSTKQLQTKIIARIGLRNNCSNSTLLCYIFQIIVTIIFLTKQCKKNRPLFCIPTIYDDKFKMITTILFLKIKTR